MKPTSRDLMSLVVELDELVRHSGRGQHSDVCDQ